MLVSKDPPRFPLVSRPRAPGIVNQSREDRDLEQNAPLNNILVLPADLVAQTADSAVLAAGLQPQNAESLGNHHLLDLVVGRGDTLEDLEALQGGGTTGGLVGDHAADGLVEDTRGSAEVEGTCERNQTCCSTGRQHRRVLSEGEMLTTAGGVVSGHLAEVGVVLDCIQIVSIRPYLVLIICRVDLDPRDGSRVGWATYA